MEPNGASVTAVPWTPFQLAELTPEHKEKFGKLDGVMDLLFMNSRYQVVLCFIGQVPPFGPVVHLSIKALDKSASHDWRDFQRIKNEICGDESEAIEIYPKESRLVDTANQYHLWVFSPSYQLPLGWTTRLVADGDSVHGSRQRPWPSGERPADCRSGQEMDSVITSILGRSHG